MAVLCIQVVAKLQRRHILRYCPGEKTSGGLVYSGSFNTFSGGTYSGNDQERRTAAAIYTMVVSWPASAPLTHVMLRRGDKQRPCTLR